MKDQLELIAQKFFLVFVANDRVSDLPEFLSYLIKQENELKPEVRVSLSALFFEDQDAKHKISRHIKEDLGVEEVVFEKNKQRDFSDISIAGFLPPLSGHKNTRMERVAYEFFCALVSGGYLKDIKIIIKNLEHFYKNYLDEVQVTVITDTPYSPELEKAIGGFCAENIHAKHAVIKQVIDKNSKGGLKIKWRDFVCDASYLRALKGF